MQRVSNLKLFETSEEPIPVTRNTDVALLSHSGRADDSSNRTVESPFIAPPQYGHLKIDLRNTQYPNGRSKPPGETLPKSRNPARRPQAWFCFLLGGPDQTMGRSRPDWSTCCCEVNLHASTRDKTEW